MRKKILPVLLLAVALMLLGCSRDTMKVSTGELDFEFIDNASKKSAAGMDPMVLDVKLLDEDKSSIYIGVNVPFNSYIKNIFMDEGGEITIDLDMKPQMENKDPFQSLAPSEVYIIKLDKAYRGAFQREGLTFTVQSNKMDRVIDYQSAQLQAWNHLDADFTSTLNCLALYNKDSELRLSYIFFFGDTENINRAGNELISGVIAVDALNGQMLEYRLFSRKNLPGTFRFAKGYTVEGWKDPLIIIGRGADGNSYFLIDMLGNPEPLKEDRALELIDSYTNSTASMDGYNLLQETSENDLGFMYTEEAFVMEKRTSRKIPIVLPENSYIVGAKWDRQGKNLYFTTEIAEPSYGNFWSYYTLWSLSLMDGSLKEITKLPAGDFYINTDGSKLAYNGLEGDLFILDLKNMDKADRILK